MNAEIENWDRYISSLMEDKEITEPQKRLILDGWLKLKEIFDDEWIQTASRWHPVLSHLQDTAKWSRLWLADFGERLSELKEEIPDKLKQRLLRESNYYSAHDEIEVASNLNRKGYAITFVKEMKNRPTTDIIARHNNREICVEVTKKGISEDEQKEIRTYNELTKFLYINPDRTKYFCKIHYQPPLSTPRLRELTEKIQEKFEKARNETGYEKFIEPGIIECYICTGENINRVPPEKRVIEGPSKYKDGSDEIRRIKGTIEDKVHKHPQLPEDKPGVLVIYDTILMLMPMITRQDFYLKLVYELGEVVNEYPQLSALVIIVTFISTEEKITKEGHNYAFLKRLEENGAVSRYTLTIKNSYPDYPLTQEEFDTIKNL